MPGSIKCGVLLLMLLALGVPANALDREQQRAKGLLEQACATCHAVGRSGRSPHADAPPFRLLGENKLYDEDFGRRLRDGLSTIHPEMPTFRFSERDAAAVIDYLREIQDRSNNQSR
jgi:mono/diheme cytochrome c family protein